MSTFPAPSLPLSDLPRLDSDFLTQIVESFEDPVFVKDEQHRWIFVNEAFCEFVGHKRNDLLGKSDYEFFPPEQAAVFWEKDDLVFSSGETNINVEKITGSDHRAKVISTRKSILTDSRGNRFLLGIFRDVTDAALRERHQEQIAHILKHLILGASQEEILEIILRVAEEALPGVIATILLLDGETRRLHPAVVSRLPEEFTQAIDGTPAKSGMGSCGEAVYLGKQVIVENIATHPNWRRVRDLALKYQLHACWSQPVFNFDGDVVATFALYFPQPSSPVPFEIEVLTTLAQLTTIALEHHRFIHETKTLRMLMTDMIDAMPSLLIAVDHSGRVLQWNAEAEKATGLSAAQVRGQALESVLSLSPEQVTRIYRAIKQRQTIHWTRINDLWTEENHWYNLTLYPISSPTEVGSVIRIDDVSNQVRLQQMMVETEKINSLGGLTAGMAHEINNPLAGILQNVQILRNRLQPGMPLNKQVAADSGCSIEAIETYMQERKIFELLETINGEGRRASSIVKNMLNFCRKGEAELVLQNCPDLLEKTLLLLEKDYDQSQGYDFRKVEVLRDYAPDLPSVPCDGSKMQQVFFNLLKNAAQAMTAAEVDHPQICVRIYAKGRSLQVEVEDNGPGIEQDTQRHIFEPFYTTKPVGSGTGLGLSVAYFIVVEMHSGKMSVTSKPNQGAKFFISLPLESVRLAS